MTARAIAGRPPKLAATHLYRLYALIVGTDPRQLSFEFALWTPEMVQVLIWREFGVKLSVVSVGRLLRVMSLSPATAAAPGLPTGPRRGRPVGARAIPRHSRRGEKAGATIYFADEACIRSDYHSGTTWAPVAHTPVVRGTGARYSVNMLSAVSAQGALRFMVHDVTVTAKVFIDFCKRLLTDATAPVYLVVDGTPATAPRP